MTSNEFVQSNECEPRFEVRSSYAGASTEADRMGRYPERYRDVRFESGAVTP